MNRLFTIIITLHIIFAAEAQQTTTINDKKIHCHIEGEVKDNTITGILLVINDGDMRVLPADTIRVHEGRFSHDFYTNTIEMYDLVALEDYNNGCWYALNFFAEEGNVYATFYGRAIDDAPSPTLHSETPLNKELISYKRKKEELYYTPLRQEKDSLEKTGKIFTPEGYILKKLYDECQDRDSLKTLSAQLKQMEKEGRLYTPEYTALAEKADKVYEQMTAHELNYIRNNHTMVSLFLLKDKKYVLQNKDQATKQPYIELFESIYEQKFPTSNMTKTLRNWITSLSVQVGTRFIDFTLPDLSGINHTLSKEIEGKIAVIDFWASWCGPCRRTSMSFIPLYNKYKEKGFTIVGVASELKSADMQRAIEKDGYPWLNLLALRGTNSIWERYGIPGGGEIFLIDRDGTILAIGATAEEIEKIIEEKLYKE